MVENIEMHGNVPVSDVSNAFRCIERCVVFFVLEDRISFYNAADRRKR